MLRSENKSYKVRGHEAWKAVKSMEDTPFNAKWPRDYLSRSALGMNFSTSKTICDKLNFYDKLDVLENDIK